ncbi:monodechloroaminopyrrolnitrin synthase PrnB family protein [Pseudomonas chlororaphis]|uniref:monodechloroaminopyrrolnitrin synthase PrnB family protein n=1 Tax=Pseudomonas chlororaphis TaxID=587753 RepID=UPI0006877B40|nr:monodechloroaminopyrrolnitrin synthase PrnB family protein [Pseudomonas chlororaphis]
MSMMDDRNLYRTIEIQRLDPLDFDIHVSQVQSANSLRDIPFLSRLLVDMCSRLHELDITSTHHVIAAMRDVGIILGSLKRHGVEPVVVVPQIEPWLIRLGAASEMVPRDTVLHYTSWNPDGNRRRAYTNDPQERALQAAVVQVFPQLSASLDISRALQDLEPQDARFAPLIDCLNDLTKTMVGAIDGVVQDVSPVFFAQTLRPYYEDIMVGDRSYLGPAAAQVPLWLVDLCVWASDRCGGQYKNFLTESIPYCLPSWRMHYESFMGEVSLVSKIAKVTDNATLLKDHNFQRSAKGVSDLLRTLKTFRGRHFGIARKAYAPEVRLYDQGSGGAPIALLKQIIDLTKDNERLVLAKRKGTHTSESEPEIA